TTCVLSTLVAYLSLPLLSLHHALPISTFSSLSLHDALPISLRGGRCGKFFQSGRAPLLAPRHRAHGRRVCAKICAQRLPPRLLRSEEHTSELQSRFDLVCRLLLEKKKSIDLALPRLADNKKT